jgi:hypothetical protein
MSMCSPMSCIFTCLVYQALNLSHCSFPLFPVAWSIQKCGISLFVIQYCCMSATCNCLLQMFNMTDHIRINKVVATKSYIRHIFLKLSFLSSFVHNPWQTIVLKFNCHTSIEKCSMWPPWVIPMTLVHILILLITFITHR